MYDVCVFHVDRRFWCLRKPSQVSVILDVVYFKVNTFLYGNASLESIVL